MCFLVLEADHSPGLLPYPTPHSPGRALSMVPAFSHRWYCSGEEEKPQGAVAGLESHECHASGPESTAEHRGARPCHSDPIGQPIEGVRPQPLRLLVRGPERGACVGQVGGWQCTPHPPKAGGRSQNLRTGRDIFPATYVGPWTISLSLGFLISKAGIIA